MSQSNVRIVATVDQATYVIRMSMVAMVPRDDDPETSDGLWLVDIKQEIVSVFQDRLTGVYNRPPSMPQVMAAWKAHINKVAAAFIEQARKSPEPSDRP